MNRIALALLFGMLFLGGGAAQPAGPASSVGPEWTEVCLRLALSPDQVLEVNRLARMIDGQARHDRTQNVGDPKALIAAAGLRNQLVDRHLLTLIAGEQIEKYRQWQADRDRDWQFLYLREGLLLSEAQGVAVRQVLSEYEQRIREQIEEDRLRDQGEGREENLTLDPGRSRSGMDRDRASWEQPSRSGGERSRLDWLEEQKLRRIQTLLTAEQLPLFRVVQKLILDQMAIQRKREPPSR